MSASRQELLALALGQLDSAEQGRVQQALDHDPALRTALRRDLDALASLLADLDPYAQSIPDGADLRLLERLRAETAPQASPLPAGRHDMQAEGATVSPAPSRTAPSHTAPPRKAQSRAGLPRTGVSRRPDPSWALPALLALAAALALGLFLRPAGDAASRYAAAPGARLETVQGTGGAVARMVRLSDGRVYVHMDRPLESGRVYQLWRLLPGPGNASLPRSLGLFESGLITRAMPQQAVLAVSVEPPGGSEQPSTPLLFKFRLR